jgi:hypothetical protein
LEENIGEDEHMKNGNYPNEKFMNSLIISYISIDYFSIAA